MHASREFKQDLRGRAGQCSNDLAWFPVLLPDSPFVHRSSGCNRFVDEVERRTGIRMDYEKPDRPQNPDN